MKCEWALKPTRSDSAIRAALAPPSAQEVQRENVGGHIMQMFFHPHSYLQYNVSTCNRYSLGLARCLKHVDLMNVKCILCMIDSICQKHCESQAISTIFHSNINKIQSIRFDCNTFFVQTKIQPQVQPLIFSYCYLFHSYRTWLALRNHFTCTFCFSSFFPTVAQICWQSTRMETCPTTCVKTTRHWTS